MRYYEIVLLRSSAPSLTYASKDKLSIGSVVSVPLKTTLKEAVVVKEVEKPEFETAEVASVSDKYYTNTQMEIAKFVSEYYFSSFGEAISLFIPYSLRQAQGTKERAVAELVEVTPSTPSSLS